MAKIPGANPRDQGKRRGKSASQRTNTDARTTANPALIGHRTWQDADARTGADTALIGNDGRIERWLHGFNPFIINTIVPSGFRTRRRPAEHQEP
jgi:hypothetical protein